MKPNTLHMIYKHIGRLAISSLALWGAASQAGQASSLPPQEARGYKLFARDLIRVTVFGEPDLNLERRIDGNGTVSLPLVGSVALQGLTVAAAEETIRKLYVDKEIFVRPQVSVLVVTYVAREVSVIGQVKDPGRVALPIETDSIDIVEAISKAGGFTRLGKPDSVRVTRKVAPGGEQTFTVDVQRMFSGRGGLQPFPVFPGDVIFIPERIL